MTTYRLMDGVSGRPGVGSSGTQPPATATSYTGDYIAGLAFEVTQGSMWFEGFWWWVATGAPTAAQKFCLWSMGAPSGVGPVLVPNTTVISGTLAAGWNYVPLAAPVQIAIGSPYVAATAVNGNFPDTLNQFAAGDPYANGITNGPLFAYPDASAATYGLPQGPFTTAGPDPTAIMPGSGNHADLLWLDVQVSDTAPGSYSGTYRLWPNKYDASPVTQIDANQPFILATEVHLTSPAALNAVWYWSPSGAASLATWAGVYDIASKTLVAANASPSWTKPDGTTAATAGGGWARCAFPGGLTLPAGSYKVCYYNANGASGSWSPTAYGYFNGSGAGAAGITSGPLYSPPNSAGASAYIYDSAGSGNTPAWSGLGTEPANGTFAITGPQYPYICVDQPGFSDGPTGAVAESFWADMEVTPASHYRLWPSTSGPSTAVSYSGNFISGVNFGVKGGGNWFEGYWWWVAPTTQSTAPVKCALWTITAPGYGVLVPGSVVTSGTLTAGQWNYIPLPTPIQLAPSWDTNSTQNGSYYVAAIGCNGNFPDTNNYWGPGQPGGSGIINGPLIAYSCGNPNGDANHMPYVSAPQGVFSTAGSDPSTTMPASQSTTDNFWVDIQVTNIPPAGYTGSYRLLPNKADSNTVVSGDAAFNYTIATEVHLSQKCTLNAIWYYRPNTATTMATRCDVWDITTGLSVASITLPTWLGIGGSAFVSGSGVSGGNGTWAKALFPGGITLPAGQYRVSVYNANGTTDGNWSAKDANSDYWGETYPGAGASGILAGPLYAPNWASASPGYLYGGTGSENPPFSAGGATAHAQPVFAEGVSGNDNAVGFPQLNAPVGTPANQTQNYWVDLEVTPVGAPSSGLLMATYL